MQVLAHRQVGDDADAVLAEVVGRADAGEHQQLGRAEHAGRQDDLLAGADRALGALLVEHLDAGGAAVLDDDLQHVHLGPHLEGRPAGVGEVAARGRVALAAGGALLEVAHAFLLGAVVVAHDLDAEGVGRGLLELQRRLGALGVAGDLDRPAGTAVVVLAVLEVLDALVGLVDRVGVPAGVALGRPRVVVGAVAAHPEQAVDRARAADDLAAGLRDDAVVHVLLRGRVVAPVDGLLDLRLGVHRADHAGLGDQQRCVLLARLEQDHRRPGLRETGRDCRPRAAGADDDVVGLVAWGARCLLLGHGGPSVRCVR